MPLPPISGHAALRARLADAIVAQRLPQVLLLTGDAGIGKQRLALWLAQRLFCERATPEPCGHCAPCQRVLGLIHPDLHWFVPVPRPKSGDSDKQLDEVAESLETIMAERRLAGRWGAIDGMQTHGIASARLIQRRASLSSVEGGWRVFIIGDAERLVPQESSTEAANALLKLLEEPPVRTLFVLTATEAGQVLTTIRSRAVPIRISRLTDQELATWATERGMSVDAAALRSASGSIGRLEAGADPLQAKARGAAQALLGAVREGAGARARAALQQGVSQARGEFTTLLDALAHTLETEAREETQRGQWNSAGVRALQIERVLEAREEAQGNVSPQLTMAALLEELSALESTPC